VGVLHVTTMSMEVVPNFPTLVGSGRTCGLLGAGTVITIPGCLLWETNTTTIATAGTAVAVAASVVSVALIVECVLLQCRHLDVGRGLLADSHAELLDVCQLALHAAMVVAWDLIDSCVAA
jgi:hypothetical protein